MSTAQELKQEADKFHLAGRGDKAIPRYQRAHQLFLDSDRSDEAIECLHALGVAQVFADDEIAGIATLKSALAQHQAARHQEGIGRVQRDIGIAYMMYRHYFDSLEYLLASRATLSLTESFAEQGITEAKIGRLYALDGEYAGIDECFDIAYQLINKAGHQAYLMAAQIDNAFACLEQSQIGFLENHLNSAWQLLVEAGEVSLQRRRVAQIYGLRIRLAINKKEWLYARKLLQQDLANVLSDISPGCLAVLERELQLKQMQETLNF